MAWWSVATHGACSTQLARSVHTRDLLRRKHTTLNKEWLQHVNPLGNSNGEEAQGGRLTRTMVRFDQDQGKPSAHHERPSTDRSLRSGQGAHQGTPTPPNATTRSPPHLHLCRVLSVHTASRTSGTRTRLLRGSLGNARWGQPDRRKGHSYVQKSPEDGYQDAHSHAGSILSCGSLRGTRRRRGTGVQVGG